MIHARSFAVPACGRLFHGISGSKCAKSANHAMKQTEDAIAIAGEKRICYHGASRGGPCKNDVKETKT